MATPNFPSPAFEGQTYEVNDVVYVYDGVKWVANSDGVTGQSEPGVRYQDGTWTPTSSRGTLTLQAGRNYWSRIGNTVTLNGCIVGFSDNTSVDTIKIQSLPYICEGGVGGVCYAGRIATSAGQINTCYTGDNSNTIHFTSSSNVKSSEQVIAEYADINSSAPGPFLWFTITYQTNDTTFDPGTGATVIEDIQGTGGGGGSGGGDVIYNGASAWGNVATNGTLNNGFNSTSSKYETGKYRIVFDTPLSTSTYSISVSSPSNGRRVSYANQLSTGFDVYTVSPGGTSFNDIGFSYSVFESNAIAPQAGVGSDGWALTSGDGILQGGYNLTVEQGETLTRYNYTFISPMPNTNYGVLVTGNPMNQGTRAVGYVYDKETTGFKVQTLDVADGGTGLGARHAVAVFASSTVTPTYTWTRDGTTLLPANSGDDVDISGTLSTSNFENDVVPIYGIRAWANVTVHNNGNININGNGNIASVVAEGDNFRVTFSTPMSSTNYAVFAMAGRDTDANNFVGFIQNSITVNDFLIGAKDNGGNALTSGLILFIQVVL